MSSRSTLSFSLNTGGSMGGISYLLASEILHKIKYSPRGFWVYLDSEKLINRYIYQDYKKQSKG